MPETPTQPIAVLKPSPDLATMMEIRARYTENYIRGEVSEKCARFYTLIEQISNSPELTDLVAQGYEHQQGAIDEMIANVNHTRKAVQALAKIVGGLDSGEYELIAWRREGVDTDKFEIGVWQSGRLRRDDPSMEWVVVALLFVFGASTIVGAVAASLYANAEKTAANADFLRAQTEQGIVKMLELAPENKREALAAAFAQAQRASAEAARARAPGEPGWLGTVGKSIGGLVTGAVDATSSILSSGALPWVLLAGVLLFGIGRRTNGGSYRAA